MSNTVSVNDLNPRESRFSLSGKTYELKKFSIAAQVWAADEFATDDKGNGLFVLSERLANVDTGAIVKTCYYLLTDKTDFPTLESFVERLGSDHTILKVLLDPLSETLGVSQPSVDETAEEIEIKK